MSESLLAIRRFAARKRRTLLLCRAAAWLTVAVFVYLLISAALCVAFSVFPWTALPVVWMLATLVLLIALAVMPAVLVSKRPSLAQTAAVIEDKCGIAHPPLSIALELAGQGDDTAGSLSLRELAYHRAANSLGMMDGVRFSIVNKYVFVC